MHTYEKFGEYFLATKVFLSELNRPQLKLGRIGGPLFGSPWIPIASGWVSDTLKIAGHENLVSQLLQKFKYANISELTVYTQ